MKDAFSSFAGSLESKMLSVYFLGNKVVRRYCMEWVKSV